MKQRTSMSFDTAYAQTRKQATNVFWKTIDDIIYDISRDQKENNYCIFIDKNHPPNAIKGTLKRLDNFAYDCVEMNIVAMAPRCINKWSFNFGQSKTFKFPFSLTYFFTCLQRV